MSIPKHSTIKTVYEHGLLEGAEEYVRRVLEVMGPSRRSRDNPHVRIGIEGEGKIPNYRIEHGYYPGEPPKEAIFGSFRGNGHSALVGNEALQEHTWSSDTLTYLEVQSLLGTIRKLPKPV